MEHDGDVRQLGSQSLSKSVPRFVLVGGGMAGRISASALHSKFASSFAGLVWDPCGGAAPALADVATIDLVDAEADVLLCSGYGHILTAAQLCRFRGGAFNAHPSILPAYRGRHAVQWAIDEGESILGVSVHRMTPIVDCGDVLLVRSCRFGIEQKYKEISEHLCNMAAEMLVELLLNISLGIRLEPVSLDLKADRPKRRRSPEDSHIEWWRSSHRVLGRVRASAPEYPAYAFTRDGQSVNFTGYVACDTPGQVLVSTEEGCLVSTGDGVIWIVPDRALAVGDVLV